MHQSLRKVFFISDTKYINWNHSGVPTHLQKHPKKKIQTLRLQKDLGRKEKDIHNHMINL